MVNCYVFFSEPLMVGKVATLIKRIEDTINIHKIVDARQLNELTDDKKDIIVTDYSCFQQIETVDVDIDLFGKILLIDDVETQEDGNLVYINRKHLLTTIGTYVSDFIDESMPEVEYVLFKISSVIPELQYPCDIYQKGSEDEFLVQFKSGQNAAKAKLDELKNASIDFLYVKRPDYVGFMEFLSQNRDVDELLEEKIEINAVEAVHGFVQDLGFDPKVVEMTKTLHQGVENRYTNKYMKKLLSRFKDMEGSYLYNHSYLTSVIALSVGKRFSWMNFENREKVYLGCVMHDLGYKDKNNALKDNLTKSQVLQLPKDQQEDILGHSTRFVKILKEMPDIHPDVIKMVENHHGIYGEESYPKQIYPTESNLLFALFILSHKFAQGLYQINFNNQKIPGLIEKIASDFDHGNYKKIMKEFCDVVQETFLEEAV